MKRSLRLLVVTAILVAVAGSAYFIRLEKQTKEASSSSPSGTRYSQSLPLHPVVERIVREGPEMPYLKFNYVIKELPLNLAVHDIDALLGFISGPRPPKFQEGQWGSLVNDIEECLTVQNVPSVKVAQALIAISRDESKIQMQRDYALQHIGGFAIYLVHTHASRDSKLPPFFADLVSELKNAAADSSKAWCGTSFNLLDGLLRSAEYRSVEIDGVTVDALVSLAVPVASNPHAPLNARLPALQLASRRGSSQSLELAREILRKPDSGIMLVQSASAVLARLGTGEDLPMLEATAIASNRHTGTALNEAIRSIQSRSHRE